MINRYRFHCPNCVRYAAIRGEENNRKAHIATVEFGLQRIAIHSRHVNVEQQAAIFIQTGSLQKVLGAFKSPAGKAGIFNYQSECIADCIIVIDNKNARFSTHTQRVK